MQAKTGAVTTTDEPDDCSSNSKRFEQSLADPIPSLREEIDRIDQNIAALLKRRFEQTRMILELKSRSQVAGKDVARETLILERVTRDVQHDGSLAAALETIYQCILQESLRDGTRGVVRCDVSSEIESSRSEPTSSVASK
jgi:chorismate mutase